MANGTGVAAPARTAAPAARRQRERWFFSGMALASAAAIFWGFSPTYFLRPLYQTAALSPLLQLHGLAFTAWIALLVVQTSLVASGRTSVHRRLGVAGGGLVAVMSVVGYLAAIDAARRGSTIPGMTPAQFLIIPLAALVVFVLLAAAALWWRRRPDVHKRLMLIATIELLTAGLARIPAIGAAGPPGFFGATDVFLLAIVVYDLATLRRLHPATLWGGLFLIASQPLRLMIAGTDAWAALATALVR